MKKLTVIVISYNFEKWIEKCLSSIVEQQTNFDFDVFIRDDNSTDSTRTVIMNFVNNQPDVSKFKLFFEDKNLGIHKNLELLIKNCESQYISHIDGDDYFTNQDRLQEQVDFLDQNTEFVIHSTSYFHHLANDTIYPSNWWYGPVKQVCDIQDIIHSNYVGFGRTFRNLFTEFNKLWSNPNWIIFYHEDWFFNFFIMKYGKSYFPFGYPSGNYRITGTGKMTKLPDEKKREIEVECGRILQEEYQKFLAENEST
jgi:glycosyltransferase involved in cell wall biosynthesis